MDDVELARARITETLHRMLAGELSFIEGSRIVNGWSHNVGFDRLSEPFVTFVAIDSETDDVPTGRAREQWSEKAVSRKNDDWDRSEAWARECGEQACRDALALLGQPDS
ncbi:hypothetical protein G7076_05010 [Sphingomonas sp. HDW15A]|uniref:hypothetical protein n=1 Tax=Sphingomonas sp. HDW15A TaxID=2714942 RepID=UPI00140CC425|nr:hypothetical protein [Sphingomonas sp. HDW15A]QIK95912.1 hypothetical protein G7076_05010 [Sphingomonas sp. HDW15A]